jgi:hypothetical protein
VCSVCVCVGTPLIMLVMLCVPQNTAYRPGPSLEEKQEAQKMHLSWDLRGSAASKGSGHVEESAPKFHGNQKRRPSGRIANSGGFKKRAALVFRASAFDPYFDLDNLAGPFAYLCILDL